MPAVAAFDSGLGGHRRDSRNQHDGLERSLQVKMMSQLGDKKTGCRDDAIYDPYRTGRGDRSCSLRAFFETRSTAPAPGQDGCPPRALVACPSHKRDAHSRRGDRTDTCGIKQVSKCVRVVSVCVSVCVCEREREGTQDKEHLCGLCMVLVLVLEGPKYFYC